MKQNSITGLEKKMNERESHSWSTANEKEFIDGLSNFTEMKIESRLSLLEKYKEAMDARKDWGTINRRMIAAHVELAIEKESKRYEVARLRSL